MSSFRFFPPELRPPPDLGYRRGAGAVSAGPTGAPAELADSAPDSTGAPACAQEEDELETGRSLPGRVAPVTYRVVLADDNAVVRQSIKRLLHQASELRLVGESKDGLETLTLVRQLQPDVLVTDLMMPGMNGMEVTRRIRLSFPATRVVVMSVNGDAPYVSGALQCGASAFVLKTACGRHLLPAIRAVLSGRTYVSPPLQEPAYS
jgi:CheY-like chemotaxis protein